PNNPSNADRTSGATHANSTGDAGDSLDSPPTTPTNTTTSTNTTTPTTSKVPASLDALRKATDPVEKAQCLGTCWKEVSLKYKGAEVGKDAAALWKIIVGAWGLSFWSVKTSTNGPLCKKKKLKKAIEDALTHATQIASKAEEDIKSGDSDVEALKGLASKGVLSGYVITLQTTNQGKNIFDDTNGKHKGGKTKMNIQITQAQSKALAAYLEILAAYAATP
ncbi:MAG: hypothetical protein AAFQ78_01665, partial [Bacteroidota bacterium]